MPTTHGLAALQGPGPVDRDSITSPACAPPVRSRSARRRHPSSAPCSSREPKAWGVTRNPWNTDRTPGGSSGGSAAAVAARASSRSAPASDGGGSTRIPAVVQRASSGIKPSHGRIPHPDADPRRRRCTARWSPPCADAARHLDVVAGPDDRDRTLAAAARGCATRTRSSRSTCRGLRVGWSARPRLRRRRPGGAPSWPGPAAEELTPAAGAGPGRRPTSTSPTR